MATGAGPSCNHESSGWNVKTWWLRFASALSPLHLLARASLLPLAGLQESSAPGGGSSARSCAAVIQETRLSMIEHARAAELDSYK